MINIPKQLWYIINPKKGDDLAYMTYYEDNQAFEKRKSTGIGWAKGWGASPDEAGVIVDNNPVENVYIGSSVSRWSTSNKLFRVKDPRGFTVEVPTDNIATLLHLTTVTKGVIQESCVWARDGGNHILLPVNSEPYLETLDKMDTLANKLIKLSDLTVGDKVKFFEDSGEYIYLGKAKATWKLKPYDMGGDYWRSTRPKTYLQEREVKDTKWEPVFAYQRTWQDEEEYGYNVYNTPKITEVVGKSDKVDSLRTGTRLYVPARISNQNTSRYCEYEVISIEWK